MRLEELRDDLVERLTADLRTRFPDARVRIDHHDGYWYGEATTDGRHWGETGLNIDAEAGFPSADAEQKFVAEAFTQLVDIGLPHDFTEPWPRCPRHLDHPLQPQLYGRYARWVCKRDEWAACRLGELS